ncbi:MAG: hypothetical protein GOMPHAMPRED_001728 [Gomphillus americanus]|uniref:Uncharacterized protein n=1 Tax=Gomphillus americanus TaxID=1940652 RepID=A0A8H3F7R1_9LECA|nr:MAG: hypothetical protein GOMPHAMPRED_001728 [Gomphillus americanus]
MLKMILWFLGLTFFAVTIEGQFHSNNTSYCGNCVAGLDRNDGMFYTIPLADTTYSLDCITEYISTNEAGAATATMTNFAILSSFDNFILSKFVPSLGSRALTVPVSIFPSYGTATVNVNPLYYGTISTIAGTTSCVGVAASPLGTVSPLRLYPTDSAAQEAATTSLLEMAYFSPLPTSCSIDFSGEPYYQVPVQWLTSSITLDASDVTGSSYYFQTPIPTTSVEQKSVAPAPTSSTLSSPSSSTLSEEPSVYYQTPVTSVGQPQHPVDPTRNSRQYIQTPITAPSPIFQSAANERQGSPSTSDLPSVSTPIPGKSVGSPSEANVDGIPTQAPVLPAAFTVGSSTIQINSESAYIISSRTLTAGGVVTIGSTTISLATDGSQVVINSKTETISQPSSEAGIGGATTSVVNGPQPTSNRIATGSDGTQITANVNGPQSTSSSIAAGSGTNQALANNSNSIGLAGQHLAFVAIGILVSMVCA